MLLLAAAIALACAARTTAQDSVSLVGLSASRAGDSAVIELHTSGAAEFTVERFTTGDWINVWSNALALNAVDEIPLDFNRPELADLATAASLVNDQRHGAVRIYLGPDADRGAIKLLDLGQSLKLIIPARRPDFAANLDSAPASDNSAQVVEAESPQNLAVLAAAAIAEALPVAARADYITTGQAAAAQSAADNVAPAATDTNPNAGSFYMPRTAAVPAPAEPKPAFTGRANSSEAEPLPAQAEVNFQRLLSDDTGTGASDGGAAEDSTADETGLDPETMQDIMREAMQLTGEALLDSAGATPEPSAAATTGGIATPSATFYDPYKQQAEISLGAPGEGAAPSGKAALKSIRIELFEILGTPLDQALTLLVAPTDYNIIVDSSVGSNVVSLSFKDSQTDLKSALDLLTRTYGLEYVVEAGTIVVAAKDKINGGLVDFVTRLFVLSFADPETVRTMLTTTGLLRDDQIEIYLGEDEYLSVNDSTELSTEAENSEQEIKPIQTNLSSTPRNAILVKAVPEQMAQIAEIISNLDRKPKLIDLEVRVCEAQEIALKNLGVSVQNNDLDTPTPIGSAWTEQGDVDGVIEAFTAGSFHRSALQFIATLNTQIQDRSVEILAQPTLSTVEGKQAIYFAGERIPYISRVTINQGIQQIETSFLNVGVTLNFKPRLDADGKLTIDVNPIVSSLIEFRRIGDLVEAPRTSNRQLATTVRVGDCEPFVLAGLISDSERETMTKVPLLGDMPLVGKLFRNKNRNGQRTEIIIVVTPHIHD